MGFLKKLFGKKKPSGSTCSLPDGIDYHCLPGVDDGFQDPEKSLEQLRIYEASGIHEVWFTPKMFRMSLKNSAGSSKISRRSIFWILPRDILEVRHQEQKERSHLLLPMQSPFSCISQPRTCWMPFSSAASRLAISCPWQRNTCWWKPASLLHR